VNRIEVNVSGAQATLANLSGAAPALTPARLAPRIGTAVKVLFQNHFRANPKNKRGWPSQNFWPRAARSVNYRPLPDGVAVTVSQQGVAQQVFGGEIKPGPGKKLLTIPAIPEAYGKRAREISGLKFVLLGREGNKKPALVEQSRGGKLLKSGAQRITNIKTMGRVWFWLVPRVRQEGDRSKMPSEARIRDTAIEEMQKAVDLFTARRKGGVA
jgi:hypothetical protein